MLKYEGKTFLLIFFAIFCLAFQSFAQEGDKFNNSNGKITPATNDKDTTNVKKTQENVSENSTKEEVEATIDSNGMIRSEGVSFNPYKEPSIVNEELLAIDVGDPQIISVSEEINIGDENDTAWVKIAGYYAIWDSNYINPYNSSPLTFNEVVNITLYDPDRGLNWAAPLKETLMTSPFGPRWGRYHHGQDLNLNYGDPVYAAFDGIVRISAYNSGYGNYVVLRHYNGLETLYGHFTQRKVETGQKVKAGQLIGLGGSTGYSTGPHLHFEIRYEGNSIDPTLIFDFTDPFNPDIKMQEFVLLPEHFRHYGNQVRTTIYHQVTMGETLESISKKYNVPVATLAQINQLEVTAELKIGQRLKIR